MAVQVEGAHPGEWILSEGQGRISRDAEVLLSGQNLTDGAVLGKITASAKFKEMDPAAVDGSQTAAAILLGDANAASADKEITVVSRLAEVLESLLVWKSGVTGGQKTTALTQLKSNHVIARSQR